MGRLGQLRRFTWDSLRARPDPGLRESWMIESALASLPSISGILLPLLLFIDMCLNCSNMISTSLQSACCQLCALFAFCFASVLRFFSLLGSFAKQRFFKQQRRFATQCRRVGRRRVKAHRRMRSISFCQPAFALHPLFVLFPDLQIVYSWFLSNKAMNRLMHSIVGNISMKQLMEVLQDKLGMSDPGLTGLKTAAKQLLQDTQRKQKVEDFYAQKSYFEIGRLLLEMPQRIKQTKVL